MSAAKALLALALLVHLLGDLPLLDYVGLTLPLLGLLVLARLDTQRLSLARLPVAMLILLGWMVASYTWSADPFGTRTVVVGLVVKASVAVAVGMALSLEQIRGVTTGVVKFILLVTVATLLVFPTYSTTPFPGDPVPGWHSFFSHKNALGAFLVIAAVCLALDRSRLRPLWLLTVGVLVVGSQSSTSLAICLMAFAVLVWRASTRAILLAPLRAAYRVLSVTLFLISAVALSRAPQVLTDVFGRTVSLTGREEIWTAVERQIVEHPWIGVGWGGAWSPLSAPAREMWREIRFQAFYAHNGYLDVVLQIGLIGGALYLFVLLQCVARLFRRLDGSPAPIWALLLLSTQLVNAFSESAPLTGGIGVLFLLLLVVVAAQRTHIDAPISSRNDAIEPMPRLPSLVTTSQTHRRARSVVGVGAAGEAGHHAAGTRYP